MVGLSLSGKTRKIPFTVVVQLLSCVELFAIPWTLAQQAPLSSTISQSLLKFMSIESVMLSDLYRLLLLPRADSLEKTLMLGKIHGI